MSSIAERLRATCRVAAVHATAPSISRLPASLGAAHRQLIGVQGRAREALSSHSLPYRRGTRLLPKSLQLEFLTELAGARSELKRLRARVPAPYDALYALDYEVDNLPGGDFSEHPEDHVGLILEMRCQRHLEGVAEQSVAYLAARLRTVLTRFTDRVGAYDRQDQLVAAGKADNRKQGRFSPSTVDDLARAISALPSLNVLGDERLTRLSNDLDPLLKLLATHDAAERLRRVREARRHALVCSGTVLEIIDEEFPASEATSEPEPAAPEPALDLARELEEVA